MRVKGRTGKQIALKEEQEEAFAQKVYLENIMSSMTDPLIVINPDATLRSVNKATLDLLGYKEDDLIGQPVNKIFLQEEDKGVLHKYFDTINIAGVAYNIGLTVLTKQGKAIPINFSGALMQQDGKMVGIVGVARDMRQIMAIISDLEKKEGELEERSKHLTRMQKAMLHMMDALQIANKEMEKTNKELQKLDQLKSDFVSTVSHELRTPLSITKEALSLVLDRIAGEINEKQSTILKTAKSNIDRLAKLIDALLDISRIEAGKVETKRQLLDIVTIVKQVVAGFEEQAKEKHLEIKTDYSASEIEIYGDADKVIQIFTNLVNNAIKFTEKGSINISVKQLKGKIECEISDTGIGISQDNLPKVFDKFQQFGRVIGSGERGTGLGLSIVKGLVDTHKGTIRVESQLGKGTTFTFIIDTNYDGLEARRN